MPKKSRWTKEAIEELRAMSLSGLAVSQIAEKLGITIESVASAASSHGVKVNRHTAAERENLRVRTRAAEKLKKLRKKHREVAARHQAEGLPAVTRTSAAYRNQLPGIGDRTKSELRAMLAEAVHNTARIAV